MENFCFLFFVSESDPIGHFDGKSIFRIRKVDYVSMKGVNLSDEADSVKSFIEHGFYYSFDEIEDYFTWNNDLLKKMSEYQDRESSEQEKLAKNAIKDNPETGAQIEKESADENYS